MRFDHLVLQFQPNNKLQKAQKLTTVVSGRKEGNQMALCKTLETIHDTLMRSNYQLYIVVITELHNTIRLQKQTNKISNITF